MDASNQDSLVNSQNGGRTGSRPLMSETDESESQRKASEGAQKEEAMEDLISAVGLGPWTYFMFLVSSLGEFLPMLLTHKLMKNILNLLQKLIRKGLVNINQNFKAKKD